VSLLNEYIEKIKEGWTNIEFESELLKLISEYNKLRNTYLLVYVAATWKPIPEVSLAHADFYIIRDLLASKKGLHKKVDMYIETLGGSGETAEEIARFLHNNFDTVSFVVSGEAKSAGTIIALSGDEILMTETGSLGPIDAQVRIGRSVTSAYDYMEWVEEKRKEAEERGRLNPFDATMVAQITPGELRSVYHALKFAEDLVVEWLTKYKFKGWTITETQKLPVTEEMKMKRAKEIANELINHSKWRSRGRSIKIDDLERIGLKITRVDEDPKLADIVYRIQTVCRMIFDNSTCFKIFATQDYKIFRQAVSIKAPIMVPAKQAIEAVDFDLHCPKCGKGYRLYAKFNPNPNIDADLKNKGLIPFPKDNILKCECGFEIDLLGIRNQIEREARKKIVL
jgi:hypothetical protein